MRKRPLLEVRNLHVSLDVDGEELPVVEGIDFSLDPGKVLALVGESGCGKSVTSLAILQLLQRGLTISGGQISFDTGDAGGVIDLAALEADGMAIRHIRGNRIAMIFQEPMSSFSLLHNFGNQIGEVIQLHKGVSRQQAREITIELLDKVGISDPERAVDQYPYEFSGGMRQRAMIAKALACNPSLLIADEPTTALDVTIQAQILDLMRSLQQEYGMAVIFITHDLGVVAQIADHVAIMYMGRIVERGPVEQIFSDPKHPYTISLLEAIPRLGDLRMRRQLVPIQGTVPSLFERPSGCTFHPRCSSFVEGRCDAAFPPLTRLSPEHSVSCILHQAPGGEAGP